MRHEGETATAANRDLGSRTSGKHSRSSNRNKDGVGGSGSRMNAGRREDPQDPENNRRESGGERSKRRSGSGSGGKRSKEAWGGGGYGLMENNDGGERNLGWKEGGGGGQRGSDDVSGVRGNLREQGKPSLKCQNAVTWKSISASRASQ